MSTSDQRSESLSLNNGVNICEYVFKYFCVSTPLQITLGVLFIVMLVSSMLDQFGKFHYFVQPHEFSLIFVLITYSRQHDILIPTYIGMSSLYQVLNYICS
jgi:hypothetical protein